MYNTIHSTCTIHNTIHVQYTIWYNTIPNTMYNTIQYNTQFMYLDKSLAASPRNICYISPRVSKHLDDERICREATGTLGVYFTNLSVEWTYIFPTILLIHWHNTVTSWIYPSLSRWKICGPMESCDQRQNAGRKAWMDGGLCKVFHNWSGFW